MERVFEVLVEKNPEVMPVFYRRAFMSCLKSSSNKNVKGGENETIVTLRDHGIYQQFLLVGNQNKPPNIAHLLIELIDGIMCIMFDIPLNRPLWDPVALGNKYI
jgi:hypothetical protein